MRLVIPALIVAVCTGCLTSRGFQTATTLGDGVTALDAEGELPITRTYSGFTPIPSGSVGVSHGLTDRLDGRIGLGTEGVCGELKFALTQDREAGGWTVSIAPNATAGYWLLGYGFTAELPVLVGVRIQERLELVASIGAKYADLLIDNLAGENRFRELSLNATFSAHYRLNESVTVFGGAQVRALPIALQSTLSPVRVGPAFGLTLRL